LFVHVLFFGDGIQLREIKKDLKSLVPPWGNSQKVPSIFVISFHPEHKEGEKRKKENESRLFARLNLSQTAFTRHDDGRVNEIFDAPLSSSKSQCR